MKRHNYDVMKLALLVIGILFMISYETDSRYASEIQYATTPTSTWRHLVTLPAGDNTFESSADNNALTRGRYYWFRARAVADNGAALTPWSKLFGAVWLTGNQPEAHYLIGKTDNTIVRIQGGK